jgi:hypothetical protein
VTRKGFHLDMPNGITHGFVEYAEARCPRAVRQAVPGWPRLLEPVDGPLELKVA